MDRPNVLINIDVPDLAAALAFYGAAFGLAAGRRLGAGALELTGLDVPVYLLEKADGSPAAGDDRRRYARHWTPVHLDIVVADIATALRRAVDAGAVVEAGVTTHAWGAIAMLADPFGHGVCLIEFRNRGYDELVEDRAPEPASRSPSLPPIKKACRGESACDSRNPPFYQAEAEGWVGSRRWRRRCVRTWRRACRIRTRSSVRGWPCWWRRRCMYVTST